MKTGPTLLIPCFLFLFASCGEDVASNRKLGTPIIDRPGVETGGADNIPSQLHRDKGAEVLSTLQEISRILGGNLAASYRTIPLIAQDDEGSPQNVSTREVLGRPQASCGIDVNLSGIDSRITDCFQKNNDQALWEGFRFGASGEGIWKLVARYDSGFEIWLDNRTGLVWSDVLSPVNWCKASGNDELPSASTSINCSELMAQTRTCQDLTLEGLGANIFWRLPTRNDFLQADLDGARFVLKNTTTEALWTATLRAASANRSEAWVYHPQEGTLSASALNSELPVRCVGAPVR